MLEIGDNMPTHVAVIMDGNGRWATHQGLSRLEGHRRGVQNVRALIEGCSKLGIPYLTVFAFSSENWKRPEKEVSWLMQLFETTLDREVQTLHKKGVQLNFIGELSALSNSIQDKIQHAIELTVKNSALHLTIAVNFGGKWDLTQACRKIAVLVQNKMLSIDDISEETIRQYLSIHSFPNPDFFIRTGGEQRISNFMLWQLAYAELYFTETCWPDFDEGEFQKAILSYTKRSRRYGGTTAAEFDRAVENFV